jgi:predicted SAM-dependent methyltransferase
MYAATNFMAWRYLKHDRLPAKDSSVTFVFSEHFLEHLFFDEALALLVECHRILTPGGIVRVVVPDSDLRTYEDPEPAGYPHRKLPFSDPEKHKTRWNVYSLSEAMRLVGLRPLPLRYCDRAGQFHDVSPEGCPELAHSADPGLACTFGYLRRPMSLIVDGIKGT